MKNKQMNSTHPFIIAVVIFRSNGVFRCVRCRSSVLMEITQQVRSALKPIRRVYKARTHARPLEHSSRSSRRRKHRAKVVMCCQSLLPCRIFFLIDTITISNLFILLLGYYLKRLFDITRTFNNHGKFLLCKMLFIVETYALGLLKC